jgi:DNA-binding protein H-NS
MTTLKNIEAQIEKLQKKALEIKSQNNEKFVKEILNRMNTLGVSIADLQKLKAAETNAVPRGTRKKASPVSSKSKKAGIPAPIKYKGPNGETWTGRGLAPKWLSALIAQGRQKEEFFIAAIPTPTVSAVTAETV